MTGIAVIIWQIIKDGKEKLKIGKLVFVLFLTVHCRKI